jgi:tRNA(Ile)-lysidine synthase
MAQAQRLLDTLADMDLQATGCPPALAALQALDRDRQANVLRRWLRVAHGAAASTAQLGELLDQIDACRTRGHDIALRVGMGRVARRGPVIDWYNP